MHNRKMGLLSLTLGVSLILGGGIAAHAAETSMRELPTLPDGADDGDVLLWSPMLGDDAAVSAAVEPAEPGQQSLAHPNSIGAGAAGAATDTALIASCLGSPSRVLEKMASKHDGTISYKCGSAQTSGLLHILNSHPASQWRSTMGGEGSVTEWIEYLVRGALKAPSEATVQPGNKRCYSTPTQVYKIVNGRPVYQRTIHASIIVSRNNKLVVTAIPTTSQSRC